MTRRTGFLQLALAALGLVVSSSAWAQVTEITLGQSLAPNDKRNWDEFRSEFDGRTITLQSLLWVVDPVLTMEDTTPAGSIVASCRPGRVAVTLSANKYLEGYVGRALPEGAKIASTKWVIMAKGKLVEAQVAIQEQGRLLIIFADQAAVDLLAALYEETSPVNFFLVQVEGAKPARAVPEISLNINRSKKLPMAALAQTLTYCETLVAAQR